MYGIWPVAVSPVRHLEDIEDETHEKHHVLSFSLFHLVHNFEIIWWLLLPISGAFMYVIWPIESFCGLPYKRFWRHHDETHEKPHISYFSFSFGDCAMFSGLLNLVGASPWHAPRRKVSDISEHLPSWPLIADCLCSALPQLHALRQIYTKTEHWSCKLDRFLCRLHEYVSLPFNLSAIGSEIHSSRIGSCNLPQI